MKLRQSSEKVSGTGGVSDDIPILYLKVELRWVLLSNHSANGEIDHS